MKPPSNRTLSIFVATSALISISPILQASETDDRIESSAKNSYVFRTYLKEDSVKTESKDGIVTLTGNVSEAFHKSLAQDTVEGLPTVKSVDNQITVSGESPVEKSDKWLILKVKTALLFHHNVNVAATEVTAEGGNVRLQGKASSQAQKDLTTEYASDVEGVNDLKNDMTVSEAKGKADRTIAEKIDDASITAQIKAALLTHRSTSALKTRIETKNSEVTVSGIAKNAAEKTLVTKLVNDIHGVTAVTNNMSLR